ncbi:plasmid maintenance system antidote protein, XRE family [Arcobacter nitrofigilis DSM 7299]|uniref:Plasmid maintenance system antidote protein, XRE family n=1 Tax=Arcobacter nitrofigilis (strain ATCC 33309 / DSM 7299 / CCUG 15893 / LMG 7604 / NCTC 12251 / CI) TaxID=572480 RepID=D5UZX2_ARCNC|nr:helix-turn-helix transcriptional regulator [Arcobacter nitrofigilis]ADG93341.1 plasmid maintenance system antidote protein, XRE family [Arcobacter nitrofigilis DSM 7299]
MTVLEEIIRNTKLTKKDFCQRIGITQQALNNYLNGRLISSEVAIKIKKEFNLSIDYILTGEKDNFTKNINFKEENQKIIEEANNKMNEIYYHLLNAERLKIKE